MSDTSPPPQNEAVQRGHEPDEVNRRWIVVSGVGLALLVALSLLMMMGVVWFLNSQSEVVAKTNREANHEISNPKVKVTANQPLQLRNLRESEEQRLNGYEWIDKKAGVARIPIDRAMGILATKGVSAAKKSQEEENDQTTN